MKVFYLLALCLFTFACQDDDDLMPTPTPPSVEIFPISYLALGDSYTIGTSVTADERWPAQLARKIGTTTNYQVRTQDIVAVNGWTTGDLLRGIESRRSELQRAYDLVSLLIGVNNQFQGRSLEQYLREFDQLLGEALAFAGGDKERIFVVSIPDYAYTPFGNGSEDISREVAIFNARAKERASEFGVPFLIIT
ncbi:MAG: GDSL-type esterase/lipase family protein, partial [Bacteroidota bacterium]